MKFRHLAYLVFTLLLISPCYGQKYLQKPYKEWNTEDVRKILSDSPWATQYQSEEGLVAAQQQQQARDQSDNNRGSYRGNQGRLDAPMPVTVRLHSALPVRQAMIRAQQLGANYDKMTADEQKKFDDSTVKFLECAVCAGYYVITLTKFKDTSTTVTDGIFQSLKLEDLKGKVWLLNDKDEKLENTQFTPPKSSTDSAVLFFKRTNDKGEAFFSPTDKLVRLAFSNEFRDNANAYSKLVPRAFEFKVSRMLLDSKLEF